MSTELDLTGFFTGRTETYSMRVPECQLRQHKRTIDAELVRCDQLLQKIIIGDTGVSIRRKAAWPQVPYHWELRDSAQTLWTGSLTLDELEMKQIPGMSDEVLHNVLAEKLRAARVTARASEQ